ncbi:hypothetical protein ACFE04_021762 [Oxalis oulophora]
MDHRLGDGSHDGEQESQKSWTPTFKENCEMAKVVTLGSDDEGNGLNQAQEEKNNVFGPMGLKRTYSPRMDRVIPEIEVEDSIETRTRTRNLKQAAMLSFNSNDGQHMIHRWRSIPPIVRYR